MRKKNQFPTWSDLLLLLGLFIVVTVGCGIFLDMMVETNNISKGFGMFLAYIIQFSIVGVVAVMQWKKHRPAGEPVIKLGFANVDVRVILWGFLMVIATGVVIEPILMLMPNRYLDALKDMMNMGGWAMLTTVICAPILEEVLFRGVLQESLTSKYGSTRGIIIASAVFAVIHIIPQQVVNAFFIGIILGYIYYLTQSVVNVIILHALNNAMAFFIGLFSTEAVTTRSLITDDRSYWIVYIVSIVIMIGSAVGVILAIRRRNAKNLAKLEATAELAIENSIHRTDINTKMNGDSTEIGTEQNKKGGNSDS